MSMPGVSNEYTLSKPWEYDTIQWVSNGSAVANGYTMSWKLECACCDGGPSLPAPTLGWYLLNATILHKVSSLFTRQNSY